MAIGKKSGGGSRKGVPNRATADVRAAIALLLERNVEKLEDWLKAVAEGEREPVVDKEGAAVLDENGEPKTKWLRAPDPGHAFRLAMDIAEYHIPKLARTEVMAPAGEGGIVCAVHFVTAKPSP